MTVSYDTELAARVRRALSHYQDVREIQMFGGLAFMLDQRMLVCVSAGGSDLLVRIAPQRDTEYLQKTGAKRAEMGQGRSMGKGWITVDKSALAQDDDFDDWMTASLAFHAQGSGKKKQRSATTKQ